MEREPLVLLHGLTMSAGAWRRVVPLLRDDFAVSTPTALGHCGGRPATSRPARIADVVDDAERILDEIGLDRPHLAGNSMGGWVALELARRGRAATVCALSPAGTWDPTSDEHRRTRRVIGGARTDTRRSHRILPLALRVPAVRAFALRATAVRGAAVSRQDVLDLVGDLLACDVAEDLLTTDEHLPLLDPAPCPITIAWSGEDRLLTPAVNGALARQLVPGARFITLPDVGHVPMLDDPALVADTIRTAARAGSLSGE
jgi:pimeloyl-ACP methyl ester carboxylesterase